MRLTENQRKGCVNVTRKRVLTFGTYTPGQHSAKFAVRTGRTNIFIHDSLSIRPPIGITAKHIGRRRQTGRWVRYPVEPHYNEPRYNEFPPKPRYNERM